jgi:predicted acylesterase/phospholipase RssA
MPRRRHMFHGKYILPENLSFIVPVNPITKLAFCGGGAKGVAYPGAITALHELGVMKHIDTVAGSSAGSFMALLVALGCQEDEIKKITNEMSFLKFLDVSFKNNIRDRGICDGNILYEMIQKVVKNKIKYHVEMLETLLNQHIPSVSLGEDPAIVKANFLKKLKLLKNIETFKFSDLEILKDCYKYYYPEYIIKDLIVTGTNITDKKLAIFSAKTSPNMEIAKAIQISAAFPIVFKAVSYNGKQYIDGGAMDNLPVRMLNAYSNDKNFTFLNDSTQCQRTLSLMLGTKETYHTLHHVNEFYSGGLLFTLKNLLSRLICKIHFLSNDAELMQALHHNYGLRTVALPTLNVGTLSPMISKNTREKITESSNTAIKDYFTNRTSEAVFYREKELMSSLLQIMREKPSTEGYHSIFAPILAANPHVSHAEKQQIKLKIAALADSVLELNREKDNEALDLLTKIKSLNGTLSEYFDIEEDNPNKLFNGNLMIRKSFVIDRQISDVRKLFEKYISSKEITTRYTLSPRYTQNARHTEILLDRLNPYQDLIYQLMDNLHSYDIINKEKQNPRINAQSTGLLDSMEYFEFQRKKADIVKILVASKSKYFQRSPNIRLLSKAINDVRSARHIHDVKVAVADVKHYYKPRTFFSIKKLFNTVFANDHMYDTSEKLDKALNQTKLRRAKT